MHAPVVADALRRDSWDVVAVASTAQLRGIPDSDLLMHAAATGRTLVTENIGDFAPLADQWAIEKKAHAGLVFTNPKRFNLATLTYPRNLIAALRTFINDPPINGESWIWWL